jgi:hypothetical protein
MLLIHQCFISYPEKSYRNVGGVQYRKWRDKSASSLYMVEKKPELTKYHLDVVLILGPIIPIIVLFSASRKQFSLPSG